MEYVLIANEVVFDYISAGIHCVCCDFKSGRILDCDSLNVGTLNNYISSKEAAFFKVEVVEQN